MSVRIVAVLCVFVFSLAHHANAWGPGGVSGFENLGSNLVNGYEAGRRARMEQDMAEQQMRMMQAETNRINAETERLKQRNIKSDEKFNKQLAEDKKKQFVKNFETNILPKIERVHPDFKTIITSNEYWAWADRQTKELEVAAKFSSDPSDIIWAVSEYKKATIPPPP